MTTPSTSKTCSGRLKAREEEWYNVPPLVRTGSTKRVRNRNRFQRR